MNAWSGASLPFDITRRPEALHPPVPLCASGRPRDLSTGLSVAYTASSSPSPTGQLTPEGADAEWMADLRRIPIHNPGQIVTEQQTLPKTGDFHHSQVIVNYNQDPLSVPPSEDPFCDPGMDPVFSHARHHPLSPSLEDPQFTERAVVMPLASNLISPPQNDLSLGDLTAPMYGSLSSFSIETPGNFFSASLSGMLLHFQRHYVSKAV